MKKEKKYIQVANLIKSRIANGDYQFMPLPGAPKLSQEIGVSYLTVRQAIQVLLDEKVLVRKDSDRLEVYMPHRPHLRVALIHSVSISAGNKWFDAIRSGALRYGCTFRSIVQNHPADPIIYDAIDGDFDLIFCCVPQNAPLFVNKIKKNKEKIVTLFENLTEYGVRCLDGISNAAVETMIHHFYERGCRNIGFVSSDSPASMERKMYWEKACSKLNCSGRAWTFPVFTQIPAKEFFYKEVKKAVGRGEFDGIDAVMCSVMDPAIGTMRALADHGIFVPDDMLLASFGNPEVARMQIPSVTVVDTPDLTPLIDEVFQHYLGQKSEKLYFNFDLSTLSPDKIIFQGESTAKGKVK